MRQQIAEAISIAQSEQEAWEREEQRLVVKRQRTLRQRRAGYISEEECKEELAAVALGLRLLQSWETAQLLEESLKLGEQLSDITACWSEASGEDQRQWMHLLVEPGGLAVDLETQQIAALAPRPALLPLLRLLDPAATPQQGAELLRLTSWQPVTRQIGPHALLRRISGGEISSGEEQLPLEMLSESFSSWQVAPFSSEADSDRGKIPQSAWSALVERLEQGASRTHMAQAYGVSVSALRRTEQRARQALSLAASAPRFRSKIPETEWKQLLQQRDQGISLAPLAQISEVAPSTVRRTEQAARQQLQRAVRSVQTPGHIAPTEWPAILAHLDQGGTFAQLARRYHVSARTIQRIEALARAQEGAQPRASFRRWCLPSSEWPTILAYVEQGVSRTHLAEMYHISLPTIRKVLQTTGRGLQEK